MKDRTTLTGLLYGGITIFLQLLGKYKSWWWYDNLAHFSAGVGLGGVITTDDSTLTQDLLAVLGLSIVWEFFEFLTNTYPWGDLPNRAAAEETILDTILVMFGAWLISKGDDDE